MSLSQLGVNAGSCSSQAPSSATDLIFINYPEIHGQGTQQSSADGGNNDIRVRAHAAKVSAHARLATSRKRAAGLQTRDGRSVFWVRTDSEPNNKRQSSGQIARSTSTQSFRSSALSQSDRLNVSCVSDILGGSIPAPQASAAALAQLAARFGASATQHGQSWIHAVLGQMGDSSPARSMLHAAAYAAAVGVCARDLDAPEIRQRADQLYGVAVKHLRGQISTPLASHATVLYSVLLLSLYECIFNTGFSAIHAHLRGVARLIQHRGPTRHRYGLEHETFRKYRMILIVIALIDRKPTFLAEDKWKSIPFTHSQPGKSSADALWDIIAELPAIVRFAELLKTDCAFMEKLHLLGQLIMRIRRCVDLLDAWTKDEFLAHRPSSDQAVLMIEGDILSLLEALDKGDASYCLDIEMMGCYCATHLLLSRIRSGLIERNWLLGMSFELPYIAEHLAEAILTACFTQLSLNSIGMHELVMVTFPLRVVAMDPRLEESGHCQRAQSLIGLANTQFRSRFNVNYTQPLLGDVVRLWHES